MSYELERQMNPRELEMMVVGRYAEQEGIAYDAVNENLHANPYEGFFDEYVDSREQMLIYGFVSGCYPTIPVDDEGVEPRRFINKLWQFKKSLSKSDEVRRDPDAKSAVDAVNEQEASNFIAFMHGKSLQDALAEYQDGFISENIVAKLVYWSKMDLIASAAVERLTPDEDTLKDATLDLSF